MIPHVARLEGHALDQFALHAEAPLHNVWNLQVGVIRGHVGSTAAVDPVLHLRNRECASHRRRNLQIAAREHARRRAVAESAEQAGIAGGSRRPEGEAVLHVVQREVGTDGSLAAVSRGPSHTQKGRKIVQVAIDHRMPVAASLQSQQNVGRSIRRAGREQRADGSWAIQALHVILRQQHEAVARIVGSLVFPAHPILEGQVAFHLPRILAVKGIVLLHRCVLLGNSLHVAGSGRCVIIARGNGRHQAGNIVEHRLRLGQFRGADPRQRRRAEAVRIRGIVAQSDARVNRVVEVRIRQQPVVFAAESQLVIAFHPREIINELADRCVAPLRQVRGCLDRARHSGIVDLRAGGLPKCILIGEGDGGMLEADTDFVRLGGADYRFPGPYEELARRNLSTRPGRPLEWRGVAVQKIGSGVECSFIERKLN